MKGGYEGGALVDRISGFFRVRREFASSLVPSATRGHSRQTVVCKPGRGSRQRPTTLYLGLGLAASRTVKEVPAATQAVVLCYGSLNG